MKQHLLRSLLYSLEVPGLGDERSIAGAFLPGAAAHFTRSAQPGCRAIALGIHPRGCPMGSVGAWQHASDAESSRGHHPAGDAVWRIRRGRPPLGAVRRRSATFSSCLAPAEAALGKAREGKRMSDARDCVQRPLGPRQLRAAGAPLLGRRFRLQRVPVW